MEALRAAEDRREPWTVVRTTLLSADCAVRLEPAVWTWKRHIIERTFDAPSRSRMIVAHRRRAAELGHLLEQLAQTAKKNDRRPAKSSTSRPRSTAAST